MMTVLIFGVTLGVIYALSALGFTVLFGVARILNFAHGALLVLAAYVSWAITAKYGSSLPIILLSVFVACIVTILFAFLINWAAVRPIARFKGLSHTKRDALILTTTLLASIAIGELTHLTFGSQPVVTAIGVPGQIALLGTPVLVSKLIVALVGLVMLFVCWLFLRSTKTGLSIQAVAANPKGAEISGVQVKYITRFTWVGYAVVTAIAGVLASAFSGVSPDSALSLAVSAFAVVVLGGLGSVVGSVVAAIVIGLAETMTTFWINPTLANFPALIIMVLTLLFLPNGLFGVAARERG